METTIKASIVASVDKKSFGDGVKFARDTGKEIDQQLKSKLELDVAQAQIKLKTIKQQLKETTDVNKTIKLQIDSNEVQRGLTESKRQLTNLVNTGDPALSRLQAKFNTVNDSIAGFKKGLTDILSGNITEGLSGIGGSFANIGKVLGAGAIAGGITAIGAGLVSATKSFADFEKELSNARAIFGLFGEEGKKAFKPLEELAIQLGATTKFTAKEAAEGISILGQAGFSTQETIATLPGVLDLAAAANISIAQSADVAASVLRQYGIDASQTGRVLDVLTKTSIDSNVSISDLQESFKYFGPTAKALGVSIEESAAAIGILGDNGIKGSVATRALGTAFANLSNPTAKQTDVLKQLGLQIFDTQGKFKGLGTLFGEIQTKTASFTQEQKISTLSTLFGNEAIQEAIVLTDNRNKLIERTTGLLNAQGVTEEIAKTQLDNLSGSYETLLGSIDSLAIKIGSFLAPAVKVLVDGLTILVNNAGLVATGILASIPAIFSFTGAITGLGGAIAFITGPIGLVVAGLSALFVGWSSNVFGVQDYTRALLGLEPTQDFLNRQTAEYTQKLLDNKKAMDEANKSGLSLAETQALMTERQQILKEALDQGVFSVEQLSERYNNNTKELESLNEKLATGVITQDQFNIATQAIIQEQTILESKLTATELATINSKDANEAYNKAKLDTTVSQQALEDLRVKAIDTTRAVLSALKLQLKSQQDFANSQKSIGLNIAGAIPSLQDQLGGSAISETTKQISDLEASLKSLETQSTKSIVASRVLGGTQGKPGDGKGGSGGKSETQKKAEQEAKEQQKLLLDTQKKKEKLIEKEKQLLIDLAKANKANSQAIYDSVVADITKVEDKIKKLDENIKTIQKSLSDLSAGQQTDVAKRVVEINNELQDQNLERQKRVELEKELAVATQNTTAEEIARQTAIDKESATDKILRENTEKKAQLEQQLADAQTAKDAELAQLKVLTDQKLALEQAYTQQYQAQIQARETSEIESINRIKEALASLRAKQASLGAGGAGGNTTNNSSTNNNQKTISNTFVIGSSVDLNTAVKKVSGF